ncbi:MAG TPA: PASTA domain-containing protein [Draconibacterium sp.]|nr:PASTA domain-containing protein [Draconibacterium sp.]
MSLKKFLTSRAFLIQIILAIILVAIIISFTLYRIKTYTRHGESFPVPNLEGLSIQEVENVVDQNNLKYEIIDSLHVDNALPGTVIEQVPSAGFRVKKNRVIFLTIKSTIPEKVVLPKLTDVSFRQALGLIENCGIVLGKVTYEPSEYNNLVLKVEQNSTEIFQGDIIEKGSTVDFVIGSNSGLQDTPLPDLTGKSFQEAEELLTSYRLNTGTVIWGQAIISSDDTLSAFVWKQYPSKNIKLVSLGTSVDLWLTLDSLKLPQPTLKIPE